MFLGLETIVLKSRGCYLEQPTTVLSVVERSEKHLNEFGENKSILWKPDATAIVILVKESDY